MSISAIASSLFQPSISQGVQNKFQQIQSEFQQLGQDLQAGNLSQAQQDFVTLQQNLPGGQQQNTSSSPLAQAFNSLAQDLQAGNLSAAQKDFTTIQQDIQQGSGQIQHHHHHHIDAGQDSSSASGQQGNPIAQAFTSLGQALQSGNLSSAQQAYATLQQDLQQFLPGAGAGSSSTTSAASPAIGALSVTA
jgi:outer membrane protein assembly factor BamD (BamD/ComL family)